MRGLLAWFRERWYRRTRKMDEQILFPTILEQAETLGDAVKCLAFHVTLDPAWHGHEDEALERFRAVAEKKGYRP